MAFDPNKPQANTPVDAVEMRNQLNGLKADYEAQIAAIPAGPQGDPGPAGPTAVIVDQNDPGGADGTVWIRPSDGNLAVRVAGAWDNRGTTKGPQGDSGPAGPEGPQGDPGEVTAQQLSDAVGAAIGGTSNNSNSIPTLDTPYGDPEKEELRAAYNSLVLVLRR